jgi:MGT family glycosyltransferase
MNPLISLSRQLTLRGHRVTFFHHPELADQVRRQGFEFVSIGGGTSTFRTRQAKHQQRPTAGIGVLRDRLNRVAGEMEMFLREAPSAIRRTGIDALIVDEIVLAGPTIAEMLRLPYFVISTSVPHNFGWCAPRWITPPLSWTDRLQKHLLEISVLRMRGPVRRRLDKFRREVGLGPIRKIKRSFPELAHLTQLPQCMDFPRCDLPATFHYTGPFIDEGARLPVDFPWNSLNSRPMIYASLGTTLKGDAATFQFIAAACEGLDLQLVISLGGRRDPEMFRDLPGNPLVVKTAPQLQLLKRAEIVITHAGPNTAFEALIEGKPMIAIPKSFDQPAIASRLEWLGTAEVLPLKELSPQRIRTALLKILNDDTYRRTARELREKILAARGLERATDLIEDALQRYQAGRVIEPRQNSVLRHVSSRDTQVILD